MKINLIENALSLIFPPACGFCNEIADSYLCEYCYEYLQTKLINRIDTYEDKFFSTHFWIFEYKDEVREKIIEYKFNNKSYLYRTFLQLILNNKSACEYIKSFDIIIPVPIHKKRQNLRGYNQSELIAKGITKKIDKLQLRTDLIQKVKNIMPQSTLTKEQRIENVIDAYRLIKSENLENKKVLLLDDVYTTGSTVNECAMVLSKLNCNDIRSNYISKGLEKKMSL